MPARWVFLGEVDAYPGDVDGEGDPVALAEARTISFGHRSKMFLASTPTPKGLSRIERGGNCPISNVIACPEAADHHAVDDD